jgi:hypothetical protein
VCFVIPGECSVVALAINAFILCVVLRLMLLCSMCLGGAKLVMSFGLAHSCYIVKAIAVKALADLGLFAILLS